MSDRQRDFESFVRTWGDANLGSLGDHTDPSDEKHIHQRRAERLTDAANAAGFSTEIATLSRSEGGLRGYVKRLYEAAEFRRKHGDI